MLLPRETLKRRKTGLLRGRALTWTHRASGLRSTATIWSGCRLIIGLHITFCEGGPSALAVHQCVFLFWAFMRNLSLWPTHCDVNHPSHLFLMACHRKGAGGGALL